MRFSCLFVASIVSLLCAPSGAQSAQPFQLWVCNPPAIGCEVSLDMCPSPTDGSYIVFGSFGSANIPVSPTVGTFLLDPNTLFTFAAGTKTAVCESVRFRIPSNPAAVGVDVHFQAAHVSVGGTPLLSNSWLMTIQNHIPGCQYLECF